MTRLALAALLTVALITPSCAFAHIGIPLDTDVSTTELGDKVGRSTSRSILGLVAWGDSSSASAAKNGGITVLRHMDAEVLVVLGFVYVSTTTVVYGD